MVEDMIAAYKVMIASEKVVLDKLEEMLNTKYATPYKLIIEQTIEFHRNTLKMNETFMGLVEIELQKLKTS